MVVILLQQIFIFKLLFLISIDTCKTKLRKRVKEMKVTGNTRIYCVTYYSNLYDSIQNVRTFDFR